MNIPVLQLPNPNNRFFLHIDASLTCVIAGILSQYQEDGLLYPITFESKTLMTTELVYPIHEQELLALKHCLNKWQYYLDGMPFTVFTDNQSLVTLQTNKNLSKHQI